MSDRLPRVLSLGAGVQSSTLLMMSIVGDLPRLDYAVFSDTGGEIPATYPHLRWLADQAVAAGIELLQVRRKRTLEDAIYSDANRSLIPLYFWNELTDQLGRTSQKCTGDFKVTPKERLLKRWVREWTGCGRSLPKEPVMEHWFGYSADEYRRAQRSILSQASWEDRRFPLIEKHMARWDCRDWMTGHGFPDPPRSACYFCSNRSNEGWRWIREQFPDLWARACAMDEMLRDIRSRGIEHARNGEGFMHPSLVPLVEADLSTQDEREGQGSLFRFGGCYSGECAT